MKTSVFISIVETNVLALHYSLTFTLLSNLQKFVYLMSCEEDKPVKAFYRSDVEKR